MGRKLTIMYVQICDVESEQALRQRVTKDFDDRLAKNYRGQLMIFRRNNLLVDE